MKPQSQKSPGCDPGSIKKLSTKMKPQLRTRSSESLAPSLGQPCRRSPVHALSELTKVLYLLALVILTLF